MGTRRPAHLLGATVVAAIAALQGISASGTTASSLGSFEGIEEPLVRYAPATGTFTPDAFVNITDEGGGLFRMRLRYRSDLWDADRDTYNKDRERAEVKGLGVHQREGETFEYSTTWRTNPEFRASPRFCHVFQLKSTDGDSGAPLITLSPLDEHRVAVKYWSGREKNPSNAREFNWQPGVWQTVRIRVKTAKNHGGEVFVSVDGDPFQGVSGVDVYRTDATEYRPKWGLYRGVTAGMSLGDDYVEHKQVTAQQWPAAASGPTDAILKVQADGETTAAAFARWKDRSSDANRADALATLAGEWASRDPVATMAAVQSLDAGEGRAAAVQRVFNRWADRDPDAVLQWAKARPPSAELDNLLWYYATDTTLRYTRRNLALAGAEVIADSALRARALDHIVLIWARTQPADARNFVEHCRRLSDPQKAEIISRINARGKPYSKRRDK